MGKNNIYVRIGLGRRIEVQLECLVKNKWAREMFLSTLIYPLHVLRTNRILNTVISRKTSKFSFFSDLYHIIRCRGNYGLGIFTGYFPFIIGLDLSLEAKEKMENNTPAEKGIIEINRLKDGGSTMKVKASFSSSTGIDFGINGEDEDDEDLDRGVDEVQVKVSN